MLCSQFIAPPNLSSQSLQNFKGVASGAARLIVILVVSSYLYGCLYLGSGFTLFQAEVTGAQCLTQGLFHFFSIDEDGICAAILIYFAACALLHDLRSLGFFGKLATNLITIANLFCIDLPSRY